MSAFKNVIGDNFALTFQQYRVNPFIGKLAALHPREIIGHVRFQLFQAPEESTGCIARDDDDAVQIADDDIAGVNDDAAALDRKIDLPRTPMQRADGRDPTGIDGKAERKNAIDIADKSVNDETGDLPMPGL